MELRNKPFKKKRLRLEKFIACLFRFLKEFGYFSEYIVAIKPRLKLCDFRNYDKEVKYIDIFEFFGRFQYHPFSRYSFPHGEKWNELHTLWEEWATEEYNLNKQVVLI